MGHPVQTIIVVGGILLILYFMNTIKTKDTTSDIAI